MSSSSEESTSVKYDNPSEDDQIVVVPDTPSKGRSPAKIKWEEVQKKAFLHWINGYLQMEDQRIDDLLEGFRDGVKLIVFLQLLTGEKIVQGYTKKPKLRVHMITNCYIALKFLEDQEVTGLTVSAEDIVDASEKNLKYILGFCWMLLRRFQNIPRKTGHDHEETQFEHNLLEWIKDNTSSHDLGITDFASLQDGRAILALLEKYDKNFVQAEDFELDDRAGTIELALKLAEVHLGIPSDILDEEELVSGTATENSLILYSTLLYNSFQNKLSMASKDSLVKQIKDLEAELKLAKEVLEEKKKSVKAVSMLQKDNLKEIEAIHAVKLDLEEDKERKIEEWAIEKKNLLQRKAELTENLTNLKEAIAGINDDLATKTEQRKIERDDLIEKKKGLEEKLAQLKDKKDEIQRGYDEACQERIDLENTVAVDQQSVGGLIANLTKQMNTHVEDMNTWKVFLKQKTTYTAETIQRDAKDELEDDGYEIMFKSLQAKLESENAILKTLLDEQVVILHEEKKTFDRNAKKARNVRAASARVETSQDSKKKDKETTEEEPKKKRRKEGDEKKKEHKKHTEEAPVEKRKKRDDDTGSKSKPKTTTETKKKRKRSH